MTVAKLIINSIFSDKQEHSLSSRESKTDLSHVKTLFQRNLVLFPRASSARYFSISRCSVFPPDPDFPDPAISSVQHGFTRSLCRTVRGQYSQGKQHCAWTSCREGCTHEVYTCWQLEVILIKWR